MSAKTSTLSPPDLTEDTYPPPHRHSPSALSNSANPEEDWSKISDASERRRIQNRIAQRNYRKKLKERLEDLERRANILDDDWFATSLETPPGDEQTSSGTSSVAGIPRPPELNTRSHSDHEENNKLFAAHNDDKNLSKNKKEESQPRILTKLSQGKLHDEYIHFDDYDDGNSGSEPEPHMALVDYRNTPSAHKQFAPDTRTNTQGWDKCIHHRVPFYNDIVATITRWFQYSRNKFEAALQPQIPSAHVRVSWICTCGRRLYVDVPADRRSYAVYLARKAAGPRNSDTITTRTRDSNSPEHTVPEQSSSVGSLTQPDASVATSSDDSSQLTIPSAADELDSSHMSGKPPSGTARYLLLCLDVGVHRISLTNVDATRIKFDYGLYREVRRAYQEIRLRRAKDWHSAFISWFYKPKTMRYVKFSLAKHTVSGPSVNVRRYDVLPPAIELKAGRYFYRTEHLEAGEFPMHPKIFMHCLFHKDDFTELDLAVEGLPNKLHQPMEYTKPNAYPGWGIHIIESFDSGLVACIITCASLLITLIASLWAGLMSDVQGGTGIGQYLLAFVGSVVLVGGGYLSTAWSLES